VKSVTPARNILRTVLRDTYSSQTITLIVLPARKTRPGSDHEHGRCRMRQPWTFRQHPVFSLGLALSRSRSLMRRTMLAGSLLRA
jgi:hypothetical protein